VGELASNKEHFVLPKKIFLSLPMRNKQAWPLPDSSRAMEPHVLPRPEKPEICLNFVSLQGDIELPQGGLDRCHGHRGRVIEYILDQDSKEPLHAGILHAQM
jgi:hypothetical protein